MEKVSLVGDMASPSNGSLLTGSEYQPPSLYLGEEEIKKLGLVALPAVGEKMELEATVEVRAISSSDGRDGKRRSVELFLNAIALEPAESEEEKNPAMVLYEMGDM